MILINLLPHREEARKKQREAFYANLGVAVVIGLVVSALAWFALDMMYSAQETRNAYLVQQNADLDAKILQINALKSEINALEARRKAVEDLQLDRNLAVHWMEDLTRLTPQGIFLTEVRQKGLELTVDGVTLTSDRVSEFLADTSSDSKSTSWITNSRWEGSIEAITISVQANEAPQRAFTFSLMFDLVRNAQNMPSDISLNNNSSGLTSHP